jgi:hypothetical protein
MRIGSNREQCLTQIACAVASFSIADHLAKGPATAEQIAAVEGINSTAAFRLEPVIDPPSPSWLGLCSGRDKVRRSGLWNQRHVDENYVPNFLDVLEAAIERNPDHSAIA